MDDYIAVTSVSGEPIVSTMMLEQDSTLGAKADFRPETGGISAYKLWQLQKKKLQYRGYHRKANLEDKEWFVFDGNNSGAVTP